MNYTLISTGFDGSCDKDKKEALIKAYDAFH